MTALAPARTRLIGRRGRWLLAAAILAVVIGFVAYVIYGGVVGSEEVMFPAKPSHECDTPGSRFGWDYEAINYDKAIDQQLAAQNPDRNDCRSLGAAAGTEVVSADGVPIAGWYIPAAHGVGPTGPTVLIVHGGKSNKSGVLRFAPPFHEAYNLVLIDLRNSGQSGRAPSTWGLDEQLDVRAMVDWLEATKHPSWIGAMGNSNGAATILAEAVGDDRIRALILDSMHADVVTQTGNVLVTEHAPHPAWPGSWAIVAAVSLRIGGDVTTVDPIRTITQLGDRPVLLTHGTADVVDRPAESAERVLHAAAEAGVPVELHYCVGAKHGEVIETCPAEFRRWVTSFLDGAIGS